MSKPHFEEYQTDEQIRRRIAWSKLTPLEKAARKGVNVEDVQEALRIGNTSDRRDLPVHHSNLEAEKISKDAREPEDIEWYDSARIKIKGKSKSEYQEKLKDAIKSKGIDPYEWEPYRNFVFTSTHEEELDYLETDINDLFSKPFTPRRRPT